MDCAGVAADLVPYHLGAVDEDTRDAVEAHLLACTSCLKIYLSLKRAADALERPRPAVKERLRAEVAKKFPATTKKREPSKVALFARRIPLYQGVALAAIAAAIALAAPSVIQKISRATPSDSNAPSIDTSRTRAQSLHIY